MINETNADARRPAYIVLLTFFEKLLICQIYKI